MGLAELTQLRWPKLRLVGIQKCSTLQGYLKPPRWWRAMWSVLALAYQPTIADGDL